LQPEIRNPDIPETGEQFYSGALARISQFMLVLWVALTIAAAIRYGWRPALGFACGSAVAYLNFHWLKRVVTALAERITRGGRQSSGKGIILRFVFRYVLMGLAAYVILTVSPASLHGLLAGLFLPVGAIACEAAYEAYVALARGI